MKNPRFKDLWARLTFKGKVRMVRNRLLMSLMPRDDEMRFAMGSCIDVIQYALKKERITRADAERFCLMVLDGKYFNVINSLSDKTFAEEK